MYMPDDCDSDYELMFGKNKKSAQEKPEAEENEKKTKTEITIETDNFFVDYPALVYCKDNNRAFLFNTERKEFGIDFRFTGPKFARFNEARQNLFFEFINWVKHVLYVNGFNRVMCLPDYGRVEYVDFGTCLSEEDMWVDVNPEVFDVDNSVEFVKAVKQFVDGIKDPVKALEDWFKFHESFDPRRKNPFEDALNDLISGILLREKN